MDSEHPEHVPPSAEVEAAERTQTIRDIRAALDNLFVLRASEDPGLFRTRYHTNGTDPDSLGRQQLSLRLGVSGVVGFREHPISAMHRTGNADFRGIVYHLSYQAPDNDTLTSGEMFEISEEDGHAEVYRMHQEKTDDGIDIVRDEPASLADLERFQLTLVDMEIDSGASWSAMKSDIETKHLREFDARTNQRRSSSDSNSPQAS